MLYCNKKKS